MDIAVSTPVSTAAPSQGIPAPLPSSATPATNSDATAAPTDTVTVSEQAQHALATATTGGTSAPVDPRADQFYSLAAVVTDTSGKYSQDDQLAAYVKFMAMPSNGGFPTGLSDFESVVGQVTSGSAIGQLVNQLNTQFDNAGISAFQFGNPDNGPAIAKAQLASLNTMSSFNQKVLFETSVNEQLPVGGSHFSDISQWIGSLQSQASTAPASATSASAAPASAATNAPASSASAPSWASDQVTQALAALNDTSGKAAVSDQINAYQLLSGMVGNSSNFDASNSANANAVDIATAFATSAFTQHVQSLMATNNSYMAQANSGTQLSEAWQRQLNAFDNLSSDDQQILTAGISTSAAQFHAGAQAVTVESWKQYSQARIDVNRAMETAASGPVADKSSAASIALAKLTASYVDPTAFTANAQAYFAQFGPAPAATADQQAADSAAPPPPPGNTSLDATQVRTQYQAIAAVSDTSGKTSLTDQLAAYQQLAGGFASQQNAAIHMATVNAFSGSSFFAKVQAVAQSYEQQSWSGRGSSELSSAKAQIGAFNSLSSGDQQIIATLSQPAGNNVTPQSYLANLVHGLNNAAQGDAINAASKSGNQTLYEALVAELNTSSDASFVFNPSPRAPVQTGTQVNQNA